MKPGSRRQPAASAAQRRNAASLLWLGPPDLAARLPISLLARALPGLPPTGGIEQVSLFLLEDRFAAGAPPDAVLSPLFWQDSDVMEVARLLWALDYSGPYRIITPPLPRPGMVVDEVLAICPGLDVALVSLTPPEAGRDA
jgi:hypothetical protein